MSMSPLFSGKSDNVDSLSIPNSLSSAHQSLNVSPNLGSASSSGVGLALPSLGGEPPSNFYHSPNDLFLEGGTVDSFKISGVNGGSDLGMQDDSELGSLYDFKRDQHTQPPYSLSATAPNTSHLFTTAVLGSQILEAERSERTKAGVGLDYMDMEAKPKYILGPSANKDKDGALAGANDGNQEYTMYAKKVFEGPRRDEPTIDAELAAIGIKGIPTIHTACVDGNLKLVRRLTDARNADVEAKDILGSRPMHAASCYGRLDIIMFLMEKGADVNAKDNYQSTPLVVTSHAQTVKLLVSYGADIHAKNVNGISAKSISLSNPYVCLAIEQGKKQLRERINTTRKYIGQIKREFIRKDICEHWSKSTGRAASGSGIVVKQGKSDGKGDGVESLAGTKDTSNSADISSSSGGVGEAATRKRKREEPSLVGGGGKKATGAREMVDGKTATGMETESASLGVKTSKREASSSIDAEDNSENEPPACIADIVLSFLYLWQHDSSENISRDSKP
mmetsp:Transcript_30178/g.56369  ORF Transcript_30178/g.56369 Transcript_30178/m.56369 type:complete len:507 (-) Transcript_30178:249-1769(-)|eukprot:CAMPEP_0170177138 /NCGR_PEP_ID=MMETSP0040_2-20121228/9847_1 /TAXON_ID=641309 /ORGANISM="Lotharella oceanica, Strain CCMP622" /LENGTH=506 /DNA_ID=CAMNT_0010419673 /DNA_START=191 /DNA_END=1711 /DNA_ORIENTATION=+